jgi:DNA-binding LytR/AlgR family response regulator
MKKNSILVIEDDDSVRENICTLLKEEGYQVFSASNGKDGIEITKKELPCLIICDILMPQLSGYEVLEELSRGKKTKTIPFIYLTARVEREDIRKGMQLGADDYLFKPFKAHELLDAISIRLNKRDVIIASNLKNKASQKKKIKKKYSVDDKIFLSVNGKPIIIQVKDIIYIVAENQYTSLKLIDGKSILIRKSITVWEQLLPPKKFLRIHRSNIINTEYIVKMERWYNSSFLIYMKDIKEPFVISKRYSAKLRKNQI